ncbi:MAG: VWA domain-containing protein [Desulfosarcina sp.]|nr:VWA domain-containing protein [Desulfobacterales bacterium]
MSAYWRKNTSHIEAAELANILRALNKITGYIGRNTGQVEWAGMSSNSDAIVLNPVVVEGRYPVSYRKFDYLVGIVAHEALRRTQWVDLVWKKTDERIRNIKTTDKILLHKIIHTGEAIFIDTLSGYSMLGNYTCAARNVAMELSTPKTSLSIDGLMHYWWMQSFGRLVSDSESMLEKPLNILAKLTEQLKEIARSGKRVVDRCDQRASLYHDGLNMLRDLVSGWKTIDKRLLWMPATPGLPKKEPLKKANPKNQLSPEVAQAVEEKLAVHSTDITPIIRSVAGTDNPDVVPTSRWDFNIPAHPVIDPRMVARLKSIIQTYANRKTVFNRGLEAGRVDRRRLYRAPITGRCFFDRQKIPVVDWNISILVDATASMSGYAKWRMVENTLGTVHKAFAGFRNRIQGYAYFEIEGICMISRLIEGNKVLSVPPCGQTASGQAIIAAAHLTPDNAAKKFIFHITDGESNFGCNVQYGIDYCQRNRIHLVTLGIGYKDREAMERQYGRSIQFISNFGQLPSAVENLFKWTLMYGKSPLPFCLTP